MLAVGMRDTALLPQYVIPAFKLSYPDAPVVEIPGGWPLPDRGRSRDAAGTARTVPADVRAHLKAEGKAQPPNPQCGVHFHG